MNTDFRDILAGTEVGDIQTVGIMQMIPLVYQTEDALHDEFAPPTVLDVTTRTYGHMRFRNATKSPTIIPLGAAYMTKAMAQDHATGKAQFIPAGSVAEDRGAACIEATQGGYLRGEGAEIRFLPQTLREQAYKIRHQNSYSKLWSAISTMSRQTGVHDHGGHLRVFMREFDSQLQAFVSEFESVPKQVGAIFLIDGIVVGAERTPNEAYWQSVYKPLVRDCYGSMAIYANKAKGIDKSPDTRTVLANFLPDGNFDVNVLVHAFELCESEQTEKVKSVVREFAMESVPVGDYTSQEQYEMHDLDGSRYVGQILWAGGEVAYASILRANSGNFSKVRPFTV